MTVWKANTFRKDSFKLGDVLTILTRFLVLIGPCSVVSGSLFHLVPACGFGVFRTRDIRRKTDPNQTNAVCFDGVCFSL